VNTELLKARQTRYAAYATLYILVMLAVVIVANVLANRYDKSYDATSNKRYSLSEQTVKIVTGLKQDATITYFGQVSSFQEAKDKLEMYGKLSPKVHVEYVDPDKNPQAARLAGIKNYGTTIVRIGARTNEAKSTSEEDVSGAFIRDLKNTSRTVCFVTGSGEHRIEDSERSGYSRFKDLLAKDSYETKAISLLEKPEIPGGCTVVVVGGPTADYQQPEVDAIKNYVEAGGRALILLDPPLKFGRPVVADNDAFTAVLSDWGVTAEKDVILDPVGQAVGLGPQVVLVTSYDPHAIVNDMKGTATAFPLSRSLAIKNGAKTIVEKLFGSSKSSVASTKLDSPEIDPRDPKNKQGPMTIAAAGNYQTGKENSQGRFVVIGSSYWATNSFVTQIGNPDFAVNTINWLASDEDLISIRPKDNDDRRITLTDSQQKWMIITSQFLLPLMVIIAGITVWWRRR
jgi:gliding motility-associatede transport system auxiliary component